MVKTISKFNKENGRVPIGIKIHDQHAPMALM
jgi:hypothetical protein